MYAQHSTQVQKDRTLGEDEALTIVEFANGATGVVENSWTKPGGIYDAVEVFGDKGQTYADIRMGNALSTYSEVGFGYAVEKAASTTGWTWPVFEEHYNYGFPQEMRHFARGKETAISDSTTGRVMQEVLYAAYASAGLGGRSLCRIVRPESRSPSISGFTRLPLEPSTRRIGSHHHRAHPRSRTTSTLNLE